MLYQNNYKYTHTSDHIKLRQSFFFLHYRHTDIEKFYPQYQLKTRTFTSEITLHGPKAYSFS